MIGISDPEDLMWS